MRADPLPALPRAAKMKKPAEHLAFLDQLRGAAILGVAVFHALDESFGFDELKWHGLLRDFDVSRLYLFLLPASWGFLGVAVFFVVSGFCIHLSHARSQEPAFGAFFIRRFFRIYPPYLACLVLFSFIYPWQKVDLSQGPGIAQFGSHLALFHNFDAHYFYGINPSFWSIAVEVQLYLLYPLLWCYAQRHGWARTLVITAIIEFTVRAAGAFHAFAFADTTLPRWATDSPLAFWFSWSVGAAVAEGYLRQHLPSVRPRTLCLLAGGTIAAYFLKPATYFVFPLAALFTAGLIVYILARAQSRAGRPVSRWPLRVLSQLGVVSYSFYLLHQPLLGLVPRLLKRLFPGTAHPLVCFLVCLAALGPIYLISKLFYRVVEKPSIAAGKRFIKKPEPGLVTVK
jgi:peptidoglycan/LPS O-acetylase OafA/YrhL